MGDYEEAADHFDRNHIPTDRMTQTEIRDYMNQEFPDETVPAGLKEEIADRVSDKRASRTEESDLSGGDYYYDEETGRWRDSNSGNFIPDE